MDNTPVREAPFVDSPQGKTPDGEGWFIVNVTEAQGMQTESYGAGTRFENMQSPFPEFGINVRLLQPGEPCALYHRENSQEAFFVISGECTAIVEDQERTMRKGDLLYVPPKTAHIVVGAGNGPSAVLMVGTRKDPDEVLYPVSEPAAKYGASVPEETDDQSKAYGDSWASMRFTKLPFGW
jgi:uncharacterized cupin superfamily protein